MREKVGVAQDGDEGLPKVPTLYHSLCAAVVCGGRINLVCQPSHVHHTSLEVVRERRENDGDGGGGLAAVAETNSSSSGVCNTSEVASCSNMYAPDTACCALASVKAMGASELPMSTSS